jgi:hypothetical protein
VSNSNPRIEVKNAASAAWFGLPGSAKVPVRMSGGGLKVPPAVEAEPTAGESRAQRWTRRARRAALDLIVMLGILTAVPVLTVSLLSGEWWRNSIRVENTREKVRQVEPLRAFTIPKDASITPLEAGRAFGSLQPYRQGNEYSDFPMAVVPQPEATWRGLRMDAGTFATAAPTSFEGPDPVKIFAAAGRGFSAKELDYLRKLATAPVWREFDRVARARSVDMIGGRFVLPFKPTAFETDMPFVRFAATKEMAYAAVSRAAYHYAIGQRDSAEIVLRSIVSFGFAVGDNGTGLVDQLIGRVVVEVGRGGLENFYVLTRDPRAAALRAPQPDNSSGAMSVPEVGDAAPGSASISQMRQEFLRRANDPREIQGVRYEALRQLSWSSCTNVRELLFGARPDVTDAFERAKLDLARFPSERAVIDLIHRSPATNRMDDLTNSMPVRRFLIGTSSIAGVVLRNPRLAACTWYATQGTINF